MGTGPSRSSWAVPAPCCRVGVDAGGGEGAHVGEHLVGRAGAGIELKAPEGPCRRNGGEADKGVLGERS